MRNSNKNMVFESRNMDINGGVSGGVGEGIMVR